MERLNLCKEVLENAIGVHRTLEEIEPLQPIDIVAVQAMEELLQYKTAEEQGLLLRLPCKVGDVVFCIFERRTKCTEHNQEFDEYLCQGCECLECDSRKEKYVQEMKAYSLDWIVTNISKIGKTVFLTREEAEKALKQMGE